MKKTLRRALLAAVNLLFFVVGTITLATAIFGMDKNPYLIVSSELALLIAMAMAFFGGRFEFMIFASFFMWFFGFFASPGFSILAAALFMLLLYFFYRIPVKKPSQQLQKSK